MIRIKLLLLAVLMYGGAVAQTHGENKTDINSYLSNSSGAQMPTIVSVNDDIAGSPYLFDNWNNRGMVFVENRKAFSFNSFNYNALKDRFETKISADSSFAFSHKGVDSIAVNNRVFKYYPKSGSEVQGYAEVLHESPKLVFVRKYHSEVKKAKQNPITGAYDFPDRVTIEEKYYLKKGSGFSPLDLKKRAVLNAFDDHQSKIKNFVKSNNLSYSNEKDVAQILKYISNL